MTVLKGNLPTTIDSTPGKILRTPHHTSNPNRYAPERRSTCPAHAQIDCRHHSHHHRSPITHMESLQCPTPCWLAGVVGAASAHTQSLLFPAKRGCCHLQLCWERSRGGSLQQPVTTMCATVVGGLVRLLQCEQCLRVMRASKHSNHTCPKPQGREKAMTAAATSPDNELGCMGIAHMQMCKQYAWHVLCTATRVGCLHTKQQSNYTNSAPHLKHTRGVPGLTLQHCGTQPDPACVPPSPLCRTAVKHTSLIVVRSTQQFCYAVWSGTTANNAATRHAEPEPTYAAQTGDEHEGLHGASASRQQEEQGQRSHLHRHAHCCRSVNARRTTSRSMDGCTNALSAHRLLTLSNCVC